MKKSLVLLLLTVAFNGCASADRAPAAAALKALRPAPEFDLENVLGGRIKSADLKGKVVILDFWATYCAPCKKEIPEYGVLAQKLKGKDIAIIGITFESGSAAEVKPYLPEFGVTYPIAMGTDRVEEDFGGLIGLPTTFVLGKDWKVYKKYIGSTPGKVNEIESIVTSLLEKDTTS